MTTQLINEATYNYLKGSNVEDRTSKQQDDIDAYEVAHNIGEEDAVEAPVAAQNEEELTQLNGNLPVDEEGLDDETAQSEELTKTAEEVALEKVSMIKADTKTAEVLASFNTQFARFSPHLADEDLQNLVAISQLANGFSKLNPHHLVLTCSDIATAEKLVKIRSYLDFDYVISDREDSYAIQGELVKAPYGTHGIYLDTAIKSANTFKHHPEAKEIKYGSKFIACVGAKPYDHNNNDLVVAYIQDAVQFAEGSAPEDILTINDKTDINIMMHKIARQQWRDDLGEQIKNYIKSAELADITKQLRPATAKTWKPFLVIAKMISDEMFKSMYQLMTKYAAMVSLDQKYSVYAAVQLALPEYEAYVSKFGFSKVVSVKTIEGWVKYFGETVAPKKVSEALTVANVIGATSNKFCLGINTSGFDLDALKRFVDSQLDMTDKRIAKLVEKMTQAPTEVAEAQAA